MGMLQSWDEQGVTPLRLAAHTRDHGLESLYAAHRRVLIDAAQGVLGCRARAEDVVHDAFLKLWESGERHAIEDPLRYLFRMVRNLAIDRLRRQNLEGRYSADEELLDELPAPLDYDYFVWKGVEPDLHPYGACYHDLANKYSTGAIEFLRQHGITTVICGGLATDYCVLNTVLQLKEAGFDVILNKAACRGIAPDTTAAALEKMQQAGVILIEQAADLAKM